MEKYLQNLIAEKGLNEAYKECVHMIDDLMSNCHSSDSDKLNKIENLLGIIEEAEIT